MTKEEIEGIVMHRTKIIDRKTLAGTVAELRRNGKTVVSTNGSFDLLHAGHVAMLEEAKSLGDVLIVGMNSDLSVTRYKGRTRPICRQDQRATMLAALTCTDYVTLFDELTPIPVLDIIQPDIHVNSPEHGYECVEREVVERHGGRIHLAQLVEGLSTSQLLARISDALDQESRRGVFLAPTIIEQEAVDTVQAICQTLIDAEFSIFLLANAGEPTSKVSVYQQHGISLHRLTQSLDDLNQIDRLVADYDLTLAKSVLLSHSMADIHLGREVNCKTILLNNSPDRDAQAQSAYALGPNFTVNSLQDVLALLHL